MSRTSAVSLYLANASAADIADWLQSLETAELGHAAMRLLFVANRRKANSVLCLVYDVACYRVGDSCFAGDAPPDDHDKWFVSIAAGSFDTDMSTVPLGASLADAEARAVEHLDLQALFFGTTEEATALAA